MSVCQDAPLDMLMYYDARVGTGMNGMFARNSLKPTKGYYPFYAWARLAECGTQVRASVEWSEAAGYTCRDAGNDVYVTAAVSRGGRHGAALVTRYTDDNNVAWERAVSVAVCGVRLRKVSCRVTDAWHTYTDVPAEIGADGSILLSMEPCSFVLLEW